MIVKTLFGDEVCTHVGANQPKDKGKRQPTPRGHAMPKGTGPQGETCGTCQHKDKQRGGFYKCRLAKACWTHSRRTDILMRDDACLKWAAIPYHPEQV